MYAVVTLRDSDEFTVVASNWLTLDKKQCCWPPFRSPEKCMEAVQNRVKPETAGKPWEKLDIIFHQHYVTFDKAKEIKEQKERSEILKRLESTQRTSNNQLHPLSPVTPTSPSRMSVDDKVEVIQMLRDIKSKVQENSTMLKKIIKYNTVSEAPSSTCVPSKNLNLPLSTLEDVTRTEMELKNAKTRKKYVKNLSGLGGFTAKDVVKKIMQQVLTEDLAIQFNWQGRGDKQAFSQLMLIDVIRDAALNRNVNRGDCETEIKKYLSNAAARKKQKEQEGPGHEIPNVISTSMMDNQPEGEALWNTFYV